MELCSKNHEEICYDSRFCPLCSVIEDQENIVSEHKANAHIIAAAPDLLEACQAWKKFLNALPKDFELQVFLWHLFQQAELSTKEALAKAERS